MILPVKNWFDHTNLNELEVVCRTAENVILYRGNIREDIPPHLEGTIRVPLDTKEVSEIFVEFWQNSYQVDCFLLKKEGYEFYVGTSYRHLLIWKNGKVVDLTPPHDILTRRIGDYLPQDEVLRDMMKKSYDILEHHPINEERRKKGLNPANSAWFWGAGKKPALTSFEERTGKKGVMISAVDLLKGIAVGAGMDRVLVEGANGGLHTNYEGKAKAAVRALVDEKYDFAYIHIEAPDEMGHQGSIQDKITAIENIDKKVLRVLLEGLDHAGEDYRILILPDHPTPIEVRTHTGDPVPYLLYDSTIKEEGMEAYNEKTAARTGNTWDDGYRLIGHLLQEETC